MSEKELSQLEVLKRNLDETKDQYAEIWNFVQSCEFDYIPTNFNNKRAADKIRVALKEVLEQVKDHENQLVKSYNLMKLI